MEQIFDSKAIRATDVIGLGGILFTFEIQLILHFE